MLDTLLAKPPDSAVTSFNRLKQAPGPATPKTVRLWTERLEWLDGLVIHNDLGTWRYLRVGAAQSKERQWPLPHRARFSFRKRAVEWPIPASSRRITS